MAAMSARERIMATRAKFAASKSKGLKTYKFPEGTTLFRILPLSSDRAQEWHRRFGKTYLKSFDGKSFFGIIDREITFEQQDPIREMIFDAMRQAPDEDVKKHYRDMLASPRCVFNALILNDKNQKPDEPVLVEMSETAFDTIMSQFLVWSEDDENYDLAALDTGHVFSCEKTGKGMDTKYTFLATPKKAPLKEEILEKVNDLDAWIQSQVEGLEQKALQFMGQVNGSVGITTNVPATALLSVNPAGTAATGSTAADTGTASNMSPAAVTTMIEPDVEDAVVEPVADDTPPFVVDEPVVEPAATTTPAASADDIDSILAELGMA